MILKKEESKGEVWPTGKAATFSSSAPLLPFLAVVPCCSAGSPGEGGCHLVGGPGLGGGGQDTGLAWFTGGPSGEADPWRPPPLNIQPRAPCTDKKASLETGVETGGLRQCGGGEEALLEESGWRRGTAPVLGPGHWSS